MAFNGGLNSKTDLKDANLAIIYAFRLLREQSIASSSFVEVTPHCPLLLCLVGDRSVRQRATAPLLHAVHRVVAITAAAADPPLLLAGVTAPRRRPGGPLRCSSSSPTTAPPPGQPLLLAVCAFALSATATARLARLQSRWSCCPRASTRQSPSSLEPPSTASAAGPPLLPTNLLVCCCWSRAARMASAPAAPPSRNTA
ncbi:hypothetical protein Scep_028021 [Stephania cephalantha]|uniref:Uncharacterized protein n=1 Tax=Stephania cephalantha TaxID=152367 RepID=A0AAP0E944_9MAGN